MIFVVYIKKYSSDQIYEYLDLTISYNTTQCQQIYSTDNSVATTFYEEGTYACGPVEGNRDDSYLTMLSSGGLMFGIINIVGNFGTGTSVFVFVYASVSCCCHRRCANLNKSVLDIQYTIR